ncbi:TDP-N-acetylfucosamine:lipid II N-acetylfucosaminyltransferase [Aeromonas sp. DNP9]|uniref:TDP-N-acetylfucosamine:lipid II N-acetylfucosaminyltransferase n=1 Tax=Aeromonas sp. DNP9 TaxID=1535548 RepID=UPI00084A3357|nr:TDP-N-acetylfucosamine:lipid II N-acetylfucosaminyltransferase [Aeromonas sp. DNP9]OEC38279.1 hypothetical protein A9G06_21190 [Aeromonas sp. DNP9]
MILHVMVMEKFMPAYIDFISANFDLSEHKFVFITSQKYMYGLNPSYPVEFLHTDEDFILLAIYFDVADKIILHGLWRDKVNSLLIQNSVWLEKSFWVMWGGDFYHAELYKPEHINVIANVGNLVTITDGDVDWVRKKYFSKGRYIKRCFSYPSNIYRELASDVVLEGGYRVLLGHSAAKDNNHKSIIDLILAAGWCEKWPDIKFFCPLSYPSNAKYVKEVISYGEEKLKEKFVPMLSFMPLDEYEMFLGSIHLAILPSWRQNGMGNLIRLLGSGIPVFINTKSTLYDLFISLDLKVFSLSDLVQFDGSTLDCSGNIDIIKGYFTESQLKNDWMSIFNS